MKKLITLFALVLSFTACKKDLLTIPPELLNPSTYSLCAVTDSVYCAGTSITWGPSGVKYPEHLAYLLGKSTAAVYNGGLGGYSSTPITESVLNDAARAGWCLIYEGGRNNAEDTAQIAKDIARAVAGRKKFFVLEILTGNWTTEHKGAALYNKITAFNASNAAKYKRHYIALKPFLQQFMNGSAFDSLCVKRDGIPQSLMIPGDSLHIAGAGNMHIAERIYNQLDQCYNPAQ